MRGHRRLQTQGLPDNAAPNAVEALIRAEMGRMKVKFFQRQRVTRPDPANLGQFIEVIEQVDTSTENLNVIRAHTERTSGGDATKGEDVHWRLSTLEFLVDGDDNITHYLCQRD